MFFYYYYLTAQIRGYSQKIRGYNPECPALTTHLSDCSLCLLEKKQKQPE